MKIVSLFFLRMSGRRTLEMRLSFCFIWCAIVWGAVTLLTGAARSQSNSPETRPQPYQDIKESELVHYGDLIDIDVVGSLEFDWRGTLTPEGFLDGFENSPEPIFALCRSETQIAADVARQYSRLLRDPKVNVTILDRSNRAVAVLTGAVKIPQRFRLKRVARLNELVVLSGGITDGASGEITVFRPRELNCFPSDDPADKKRPDVLRVSIGDLIAGKDEANPRILSGDVVTVIEAMPIYVIGGVRTPKQLYSRSDLTLSRAIAAAGGPSKGALESEVTIFRREPKQTKTIIADLKKIRDGSMDDIPLKPYDVVDVGEKGRARRIFPPTISQPDAGGRELYRTAVKIIE
jgi:protein involved in polysaccharide export with SLBB domain